MGCLASSNLPPREHRVRAPLEVFQRVRETVGDYTVGCRFLSTDAIEGGSTVDDAVYFGFRLHDDPEQVSRQLARRDRFPGDWIEVNIDSYFDRRTAFSFTLSCSGTQGDELVSNDGARWDTNWNPVWHGAAQLDAGY